MHNHGTQSFSMNKLISQHPGLHYSQEINDICRPLQNLNITYFAHIQVDDKGQFSGLSNNPGFTEHYLKNEYYNADIHLADNNKLGKYVLWDAIERRGQSEKMHLEAAQFGIQHTFTIIEKNNNHSHFYHFANNSASKAINQVYLANLDLLNLFIKHFKENINQSKKLANAFDLHFSIDKDSEGFIIENSDNSLLTDKDIFLNEIKITNETNIIHSLINQGENSRLTKREIECLNLYASGKIANDIAIRLGLSKRTVQHYLDNAKLKLGIKSKNELLEKVINNFLNIQKIA